MLKKLIKNKYLTFDFNTIKRILSIQTSGEENSIILKGGKLI